MRVSMLLHKALAQPIKYAFYTSKPYRSNLEWICAHIFARSKRLILGGGGGHHPKFKNARRPLTQRQLSNKQQTNRHQTNNAREPPLMVAPLSGLLRLPLTVTLQGLRL